MGSEMCIRDSHRTGTGYFQRIRDGFQDWIDRLCDDVLYGDYFLYRLRLFYSCKGKKYPLYHTRRSACNTCRHCGQCMAGGDDDCVDSHGKTHVTGPACRAPFLRQIFLQDTIQLPQVDGLRHMAVHSGFQRLLLVLRECVGCHGDDRKLLQIRSACTAYLL